MPEVPREPVRLDPNADSDLFQANDPVTSKKMMQGCGIVMLIIAIPFLLLFIFAVQFILILLSGCYMNGVESCNKISLFGAANVFNIPIAVILVGIYAYLYLKARRKNNKNHNQSEENGTNPDL
jgi:hypothetical protein